MTSQPISQPSETPRQTLTINRLGHLGDAIAETPDGPIYVAMALPGEVVEATGEARITAPKIITPSEDRVKAPCPHYRSCGGCVLQHAADPFVARWKAEVVETALRGQGIEAHTTQTLTSPTQSRRRAVVTGRRTKKGALVGFHARGSDTIIEIPQCKLLDPALMAALPAAQDATLAGSSRKGEIAFTLTLSDSGVDMACEGGKEMDPALFTTLAGLAETHSLARISWNGEAVATRAPAQQTMGKARVQPPSGAFLQATRHGEAALLEAVKAIVGDAPRVVDLFTGCGTFALPLAETSEVHAVESEPAMIRALDTGWRSAQGLKRVTTEARDLFRRPLLPDELKPFDVVVLDPPRAGAEAQIEQIALSEVHKIAYVSCNPITFARDARRLITAGFSLGPLTVVDQFRWSTHVELVAEFTRPSR
ncbi:class I SAM-dependent RNA methyltransferase [Albirhodobacter sp. R86504]|jgi:23S rRNA (uracil1939-C5)-methyltransferase|uniref:class I SAM-dependent RNA methyltransferase n=1 Tax=Albirhodobacter sp. R86504 TaxID=3093848 RepID=UPI00366CF004